MKKARLVSLFLSTVLALSAIPFTAVTVGAAEAPTGTIGEGEKIVLTNGTDTNGWTAEDSNMTTKFVDGSTFYRVTPPAQYSYLGYAQLPIEYNPIDENLILTFKARRSDASGDDTMYVRFGGSANTVAFPITDSFAEYTMTKTVAGRNVLFFGAQKATNDNKPFDLLGMKISKGGVDIFSEGIYNGGVWSENWTAANKAVAELVTEDAFISVGDAEDNLKKLYYTFDEPVTLEPGIYRLSGQFRPHVYEAEKNGQPVTRGFRFGFYSSETAASPVSAAGLSDGITTVQTPTNGALSWSTLSYMFEVSETQTLTRIDIFGGTNGADAENLDATAYDLKSLTFERVGAPEPEVEGNLIVDGTCNFGVPEGMIAKNGGSITHGEGFAVADECSAGTDYISYIPALKKAVNPSHSYRLSFRIRCYDVNESCNIRLYNSDGKSTANAVDGYVGANQKNIVSVDGEWKTVTINIGPNENSGVFLNEGIGIRIHGYNKAAGTHGAGFAKLCLDSFTLIDITEAYGIGAYTEMIKDGDFTTGVPKGFYDYNNLPITHNIDAGGNGYITLSENAGGLKAVQYTSSLEELLNPALLYRFSFKIRSNTPGESSRVRLFSIQSKALQVLATGNQYVNITDEWQTVVLDITPDSVNTALIGEKGQLSFIFHGDGGKGLKSIDIDDFSLICLTPPEVKGNLIENGSFNNSEAEVNLEGWSDEYPGGEPKWLVLDGSGAVEIPERNNGNQAAKFTSDIKLSPDKHYELSFRIRTMTDDETSVLRLYTEANGNPANPIVPTANMALSENKNHVEINSEWQTFTFRINASTNSIFAAAEQFNIRIVGAESPVAGHCTYYIDDIVLLEIAGEDDEIPNIGIIMMLLLKKRQGDGGSASVSDKDFVRTNLIEGATSESAISKWKIYKQTLEAKKDGDTEYLTAGGITVNYQGFTYNSGVTLQPGTYEFSCKLRTAVKGETTVLRVANTEGKVESVLDVGNDWVAASYRFTVSAPIEFTVKIVGGTKAEYIQSYDIADMKLIDVNEKAPSGEKEETERSNVNLIEAATGDSTLSLWNAKKQ